MMRTIELTIHAEEDWHELIIAELSDLDFDAFLQEDRAVKGYIAAPQWTDVKREYIERLVASLTGSVHIEEQVIEPVNWNRQWEETIRPVVVGTFLIKPTWAERPQGTDEKILLEIDPKMSFGTGYHESTRLALRLMPDHVHIDNKVLDAGTGTGILAIAAVKLGAASTIAFDIDEWAQQNAVENIYLNRVADRVRFREGAIDVIPEDGFDVILANINRNVLLELMPEFEQKLRPNGRLLLAGLLQTDRDRMLEAAAAHHFNCLEEAVEGEWWAAVFRRTLN
jgi:ribosomal protein L11 methyltransferase